MLAYTFHNQLSLFNTSKKDSLILIIAIYDPTIHIGIQYDIIKNM